MDANFHVDEARGACPGHPDDFFALAGDASSIEIEILPAGPGFVGAIKVTAMVSLGVEIPFDADALTDGGFIGLCGVFCTCSCEENCGCHSQCSASDRPLGVSATTEVQITILVHHDQVTGEISVSMGPDGFQAPNLSDNTVITCGCANEIVAKAHQSIFLTFIMWWKDTTLPALAQGMLDTFEAGIVPALNEKLSQYGPITAPQACSTDCGLPDGVTLSYRIPIAPDFVPSQHGRMGYIEMKVNVEICVRPKQGKPCQAPARTTGGECCFPLSDPRDETAAPVAPPALSERPYERPGGERSTMLAGLRASSSLMNGVSWAMGVADLFLTVNGQQLQDALLSSNISWAKQAEPPVLQVPGDDLVDFIWSDGFVKVHCIGPECSSLDCSQQPRTTSGKEFCNLYAQKPTCQNTEPADRCTWMEERCSANMLDFKWSKLIGIGFFNHTYGGCNHQWASDSTQCPGQTAASREPAPEGRGECRLSDDATTY